MEDFTIQDKVIDYTSNEVYNSKTCQGALGVKVTNTAINCTQQNIFWQDCFAHALQCAYKASVLDCKSEDEEVIIVLCIEMVQNILVTCPTWTNKSSLGSIELKNAQHHFGLKTHKMLTPIKTRWGYFICALQCLIENRASIDHMYNTMEGVG